MHGVCRLSITFGHEWPVGALDPDQPLPLRSWTHVAIVLSPKGSRVRRDCVRMRMRACVCECVRVTERDGLYVRASMRRGGVE